MASVSSALLHNAGDTIIDLPRAHVLMSYMRPLRVAERSTEAGDIQTVNDDHLTIITDLVLPETRAYLGGLNCACPYPYGGEKLY